MNNLAKRKHARFGNIKKTTKKVKRVHQEPVAGGSDTGAARIRPIKMTPQKRNAEVRCVPRSPFDLNLLPVFTIAEVFLSKYDLIMDDNSTELDR